MHILEFKLIWFPFGNAILSATKSKSNDDLVFNLIWAPCWYLIDRFMLLNMLLTCQKWILFKFQTTVSNVGNLTNFKEIIRFLSAKSWNRCKTSLRVFCNILKLGKGYDGCKIYQFYRLEGLFWFSTPSWNQKIMVKSSQNLILSGLGA